MIAKLIFQYHYSSLQYQMILHKSFWYAHEILSMLKLHFFSELFDEEKKNIIN